MVNVYNTFQGLGVCFQNVYAAFGVLLLMLPALPDFATGKCSTVVLLCVCGRVVSAEAAGRLLLNEAATGCSMVYGALFETLRSWFVLLPHSSGSSQVLACLLAESCSEELYITLLV